MNDYPILDGVAPSWADIKTTFKAYKGGLLETADYAAINTGTTIERGKQMGASGGRKMRRTTGQKADEASVTYYRTGFQALLRTFIPIAPRRNGVAVIGNIAFDMNIQHTPEGTVEIYQRKVLGCVINGAAINAAEGTDPSQVEVPLDVMQIVDVVDGVEISLL